MRDLIVEATSRWYGPTLSCPPGNHPASFMPAPWEEDHNSQSLCLHEFLPSKWSLCYYPHDNVPHISAHHNTRSHSLLKTVLGEIGDQYCSSMHINQPNWQPWHWPTYLPPYEYTLAHLPKVTALAHTASAWHDNQSEQGEAVAGNLM